MRRALPRRAWRPWRTAAVLAVVTALAWSGLPAAQQRAPQRIEIDLEPHGVLRWQRGESPILLTEVRRGDGWITIARRLSGTADTARAIRHANEPLSNPLLDRPLRVPLEVLRADVRLLALARLFPMDRRVRTGYEHLVLDPFAGGEESWEWLAAVFCGSGARANDLRKANPALAQKGLSRGAIMAVPEALLLDAFRRLEVRPSTVPTATPRPAATPVRVAVASPTVAAAATGAPQIPVTPPAANGPLSYGSDAEGEFAVYRLRKGEALYSAVVVRFTGQLHANQVNATALEIAARSGISDVTSIPIGYPIKIPFEWLLPEHLPSKHPRRVAWEREKRELASFLEVVQAADLSGVHVIIDAGHGGRDTGAVVSGLWEATYVYDIACRIKARLERHTRATVYMTRRDRKLGFAVPDAARLPQHRDQVLLTTPNYDLEDSTTGVHLRWYLSNDHVRRAEKAGVARSKTVFISVHADSLHPSVRGAMVYVSSRYLRRDSFTAHRRGIEAFAEYRNQPTVRLDSRFNARAEASSRHLAGKILERVRANHLEVHPYEPVRDRVLRGRRTWVPAVLRYSTAQHAVLLECCNMANAEDRAQLGRPEWRDLYARAVVEGMAAAFGGD